MYYCMLAKILAVLLLLLAAPAAEAAPPYPTSISSSCSATASQMQWYSLKPAASPAKRGRLQQRRSELCLTIEQPEGGCTAEYSAGAAVVVARCGSGCNADDMLGKAGQLWSPAAGTAELMDPQLCRSEAGTELSELCLQYNGAGRPDKPEVSRGR
jgi:hypothetical protein